MKQGLNLWPGFRGQHVDAQVGGSDRVCLVGDQVAASLRTATAAPENVKASNRPSSANTAAWAGAVPLARSPLSLAASRLPRRRPISGGSQHEQQQADDTECRDQNVNFTPVSLQGSSAAGMPAGLRTAPIWLTNAQAMSKRAIAFACFFRPHCQWRSSRGLSFTSVQPELFRCPHALSNAFADFDGDGDLDLAVSFESGAIHLYRNDANTFVEVGAHARSAGCGAADPGPELGRLRWRRRPGPARRRVGRRRRAGPQPPVPERWRQALSWRSQKDLGMVVPDADSRQANWVDYDNDGDLDLLSAQRSGRNRMFRNEGGKFTDVSEELGLADPRRTVGSCWFDMDQDGDLDVFQANQQADKDTLYRNDGATFTDIAPQLGMHQPERTLTEGGVGCTVGDLRQRRAAGPLRRDLWHDAALSQPGRREVSRSRWASRRAAKLHAVGASWGDVDNDGDLDLSSPHMWMERTGYSRAHTVRERAGPIRRRRWARTARFARRITACSGRISTRTATSISP